MFSIAAFLFVLPGEVSARGRNNQTLRKAIVKIYTVSNRPNYYLPWAMQGPASSTGSGCVIAGRRILTNAHVVSDQTFITVRRYGDPKRYKARVLFVSHDADLALLTVEEKSFFAGIKPLKIGGLPEVQQEVLVYGFPMGGDTLSTTKGVVSRVEHQAYVHSGRALLAAQIDAAINPGNSGGPVIAGSRIIGVVMQAIPSAQSIGYLVPAPVIAHFLKDVSDGRFDGIPSLGTVWMQKMENSAGKRLHGLSEGKTGVLVSVVMEEDWGADRFLKGDVLMSVGGYPIADDATIEFRKGERTAFPYAYQQQQIGEFVRLGILRDGKEKNIRILLKHGWESELLVPHERYDRMPEYFIYGGLIFCPLSVDYLKAWGAKWQETATKSLVAKLDFNICSKQGEEVVILSRVLPVEVNQGYHGTMDWQVSSVNGNKIKNLRELITAVEAVKGPYVIFASESGIELVLDRKIVEAGQKQLFETYKIPKDRHLEGK